MSNAACLKKILCDTSVPPPQRIVNAINYMQEQSESKYSTDPSAQMALIEVIASIAVPSAEKVIHDIVEKLGVT